MVKQLQQRIALCDAVLASVVHSAESDEVLWQATMDVRADAVKRLRALGVDVPSGE